MKFIVRVPEIHICEIEVNEINKEMALEAVLNGAGEIKETYYYCTDDDPGSWEIDEVK